jgi:hypothetical protein
MNQNQKQILLFVSSTCDYSKNILNLIVSNNLKDYFLIINVDNPNNKLPPFVTCTPLIFLKNQGQIIIDENIKLYIETVMIPQTRQAQMRPSQNQSQSSQSQQQNANLINQRQNEPMMSDISKFSIFSSIGNESVDPINNFVFVNDKTNEPPPPPQNQLAQNSEGLRESKFDSKLFEQYAQQRANDLSTFAAPKRA